MSQVPVPPPDTTSPPTAAAACEQHAHRALDQVGLGVAGLAHEVALVAHHAAHARGPASGPGRPAARRPSGSQPQRGRPTLTSISTSGTRAFAAAAIVSSESTATVMRADAALDHRREPREVEALVGQQQVVAQPGGRHAHHLAHGGAAEPAVPGLGQPGAPGRST